MTNGRRRLALMGAAGYLAVLSLAAGASPAAGSVSVGTTPFPGATLDPCNPNFDRIQPSVTSGSSYVVPYTGSITAWSHRASSSMTQLVTFKVYRPVAGASYTVIGSDTTRTLTPSMLNTFSGLSIPVRPGDLIGLNADPVTPNYGCASPSTGESYRFRSGNLAVGEGGEFTSIATDRRLNVRATLNPSNTFVLSSPSLNKRKGFATITATVPNPGQVVLSGKGVIPAVARPAVTVASPGPVELTIRALGKSRKRLSRKGKATVVPTVTYTPTRGDPGVQSTSLRLRKRLKKRRR